MNNIERIEVDHEGKCPEGYDYVKAHKIRKTGVYIRPFCRKSKQKDIYGESKSEAVQQAQKLRNEGERVRVEETNKKRHLYAPFVGKKRIKPVEKTVEKKPFEKRIPKETVEIRDEGERAYIAKITGPDKTYHYERDFIQTIRTSTGGSRKHPTYAVYFRGELPYGTIVDTASWSGMVVPKSKRYPDGIKKIYTEGIDARVGMNRLFEARKKSGYSEKVE